MQKSPKCTLAAFLIFPFSKWWAFEAGMVACAIYGKSHFAANLILVQMNSYPFAIFQGVSTATSIGIGNALGWFLPVFRKRKRKRLFLSAASK